MLALENKDKNSTIAVVVGTLEVIERKNHLKKIQIAHHFENSP